MSLFRHGGFCLVQFIGQSQSSVLPRPTAHHFKAFSTTRIWCDRTSQKSESPVHQAPRSSLQRNAQRPKDDGEAGLPEADDSETVVWPEFRVRYFRPAIWAIVVSGGIFAGLAYLQAKHELKPNTTQGWLEAPQWGTPKRGPPTPTELATHTWAQLNPMSKLSTGIIAANSLVHLTSFVAPVYWHNLWHTPARNVNYTLFTSMFVHSGPFHLFVNMYFTYNFMIPVGYSRALEGNPYQVGAFFLATGVLSGYAQHLATLITPNKRAIPEVLIRCGGASGALLGMLGVFCMQYPNAGLGIMFVPVHFDAQYVLPAIMLFDFIGMVRGYSFVNFGHAAHLSGALVGVAYSTLDGNNRLWKPLVRFWKQQLQQ
ncbi:hypothetical protein EK21DRAFT_78411 [Setomelanomma holmii]|uniref:Peptidase S54 rhomboid domain-containing protein n=1 Tax=Setomelanomma holmii TaxID=210430 RepID=A0A9P4H009_9PLEO|nr:hypothetical protein EK21DRAFT_78411 [Setomelanomma holmii]